MVFLVDAVDRERFPEAKRELDVNIVQIYLLLYFSHAFTKHFQALLCSEELANVPFLILGNKIDMGRAASEDDLRYQLGLYETYGKEVFIYIMCIILLLLLLLLLLLNIVCDSRRKLVTQTFVRLSFTCAPLSRRWVTVMVREFSLFTRVISIYLD